MERISRILVKLWKEYFLSLSSRAARISVNFAESQTRVFNLMFLNDVDLFRA